jgi:hypothetical protein
MYFLISLSRTHRRRVAVGIVDGIAIGWFLARDWLVLYSLQLGCYLATAIYPAVA